jgi:phosphoglycolate phosphatase
MIGVANEVYPIQREKFEQKYERLEMDYVSNAEYPPSLIDKIMGEKKSLLPFIKACKPRAESVIRAKQLSKDTKVFSHWDKENYFLGKVGDYIAAPENDFGDVYIINREIFAKTYAPF